MKKYAFLFSLTLAFTIIMLIESFSQRLYPIPPGTDRNNKEQMKAYIDHLPATSFVLVLVAWCAGAFLGSFMLQRIRKNTTPKQAILFGVILLVLTAVELVAIPGPKWFTISALVCPVPLALLGYKLGMDRH